MSIRPARALLLPEEQKHCVNKSARQGEEAGVGWGGRRHGGAVGGLERWVFRACVQVGKGETGHSEQVSE